MKPEGRYMLIDRRNRNFFYWSATPILAASVLLSCTEDGQPRPGGERTASVATALGVTSSGAIPCSARVDAIIANSGQVASDIFSLVDSYESRKGAYGGSNAGSSATVEAAGAVLQLGGFIDGSIVQNTAAGLVAPAVPIGATPLPIGSGSPGALTIEHACDSITLRPGNYVAQDVDIDWPGAIHVFPAGPVNIFVTGRLHLAGEENAGGVPANLQFVVTSGEEVSVGPLGTLTGSVFAPSSDVDVFSVVFGSVVGSSVHLMPLSAVHFDEDSTCPPTPPSTPAVPPPPLPAPPPPVVGCYVNTPNGWQTTPCADPAIVASHYGVPDAQLTATASAPAPSLAFGQLAVTLPQVGGERNGYLASTAGMRGCKSTGAASSNQFSVQNNTNPFTIASGPHAGDSAAYQFAIQSDGTTSTICIWNVDVTAQTYHTTCVSPVPHDRAGGLRPFDAANIAASTNSNGTVSMVTQLSWVASGQPDQYAVVAPDTFGLSGNWTQVSGGILGLGLCSQAQFTNAEVMTQVLASSCPGDTETTSPVCTPPNLQPNAMAATGNAGTLETNNLTVSAGPSLAYLNADLLVSDQTATTSGACLGKSHAYLQDNPIDKGATPSNVGGRVFWESPDIFLVPSGTPVDPNAISSETVITPGGSFDVWVRVHNDLGCADVTGAKTLVYIANPSALSSEWTPLTGTTYVGGSGGSAGVTVPAGGEALIGPLTFTAPTTGIGNGHKCIIASIEADGEPAPTNSFDAPDSNQVAQRNLQFVGPCEYPLTNGTSSDGTAQITLTVTPNTAISPSLSGLPDIEVTFDDADWSWFDVWSVQLENGFDYAVTHDVAAKTTTVRLGTFSVALPAVPLAASASRNARGVLNLPSGGAGATLQIAATLTEAGAGGAVLVANGGSCVGVAPLLAQ